MKQQRTGYHNLVLCFSVFQVVKGETDVDGKAVLVGIVPIGIVQGKVIHVRLIVVARHVQKSFLLLSSAPAREKRGAGGRESPRERAAGAENKNAVQDMEEPTLRKNRILCTPAQHK